MIKLIATDLDGTFLDSKKNKPSDFPEVFKEIKRRGITLPPPPAETTTAPQCILKIT